MRKIISLLILIFCISCTAQVSMTGMVSKINSANNFTIISGSKSYTVTLTDTKLYENSQTNLDAVKYLTEKLLSKDVVITDIVKQGDVIMGNAIYNCINYNVKDDIPCSAGNVLNVEMLKLKLIQYSGSNEFLKKISRE
ncbi:hypothetical protein [Flavobacterium rivuli]|nr:hypothetical protein [Flavobacterium rivuli]